MCRIDKFVRTGHSMSEVICLESPFGKRSFVKRSDMCSCPMTVVRSILLLWISATFVCFVLAGSTMGDVLLSEPNDFTVNKSDIIGVCMFESVDGDPPFFHANPPDRVSFKVDRPIKGCKRGQILSVFEWISARKPVAHRPVGGFDLIPPSEGQIEKWKRASVIIPEKDVPILLFLTHGDGDTLRQYVNEWGQPVFVANASEDQITLVNGLASLRLQLRQTELVYRKGAPVLVHGILENVSEEEQKLDPKHTKIIELWAPGTHPKLMDMTAMEVGERVDPIRVKAGATEEFDWNLCDLLPIDCSVAAHYQVELQIPAMCSQPVGEERFKFWILDGMTFEEAAYWSALVFAGKVKEVRPQPNGTIEVEFRDLEYLGVRMLHETFVWPHDRLDPPQVGDSLIVFVDYANPNTKLPEIIYVTERTDSLERMVEVVHRSTFPPSLTEEDRKKIWEDRRERMHESRKIAKERR